jgi:hypothetical protein
MKTIFSILMLAFAVHSESLLANDQSCTLEHFHESATAKASALICGEFKFESKSSLPRRQTFEKCQNVVVEFTSRQGTNGQVYSVEMYDPQTGKSPSGKMSGTTTLEVKAFPSEFRLLRSVPYKDKKHVLSDEYFLNCR